MKTDLEKIRRQLRKMAFGKPNDCVKLAMCEDVDIEKLDLSMLTEIKRSEKGTVEIKLLDRTKVLEQLAALAPARWAAVDAAPALSSTRDTNCSYCEGGSSCEPPSVGSTG